MRLITQNYFQKINDVYQVHKVYFYLVQEGDISGPSPIESAEGGAGHQHSDQSQILHDVTAFLFIDWLWLLTLQCCGLWRII